MIHVQEAGQKKMSPEGPCGRGAAGLEAALAVRHACGVELAREAGALALALRPRLGRPEAKSTIDHATEADHAVERLVRDRLSERFGDAVIGEEHGGTAADSVWVVDPIDGTTNYIHGTSRWCIAIAYVRRGQIESGVIHAPETGELFAARRGGGAFLNGRPIRVSRLAHGASPVVELGWSERRPLRAFSALLQRLVEAGVEFRRHGSGALALADVACGRSDGYAELHMNAWDALAGLLLVEEAGGRICEFLADDGLTQGNLVWAATPEVAVALTAALAEAA